MKIFDFRCAACGVTAEYFLNEGEVPLCSTCGSDKMSKLISFRSIEGEAFKPQFVDIDANPVFCETKKDLKRELDKRKLKSFYTH